MRRGPVTVVHLPDPPPSGPPVRAAFGVGRKVGNAVVRNRVRRRLRSVLRELEDGTGIDIADQPAARLAPGTYLLTVAPEAAELPYAELRRHVAAACAAVAGSR